MFYHVIVETKEKVGKDKKNKQIFEFDKNSLEEIKKDIVIPFVSEKDFQFDGHFLSHSEITRIAVKESKLKIDQVVSLVQNSIPANFIVFMTRQKVINNIKHVTDITKKVFESSKLKNSNRNKKVIKKPVDMENIFIVHGHDKSYKHQVARFITDVELNPIILHEQINSGRTIIEKIEHYSNVGFAIVIYTPCDQGGKNEENIKLMPRARQNVVFEHGYLIGKLGRQNVCALVDTTVEVPNDISGIVYITLDEHDAWKYKIAQEMQNSGYPVDMNKIQ